MAVYLLIGIGAGILITGILVWQLMPGLMINQHKSRFDFDKTVEKIQNAIKDQGWSSPITLDMNESITKHGISFTPRVKIIQLCHPEHAANVLTSDRHVSSIMPCAIAVFEGDDGKIYLSKMNTGLMGKMFGGNIARVMGNHVASDEHRIINEVVED